MELPIPTHLVDFLLIDKKKTNDKKLVAKLQCCNNFDFIIKKSQNEYVTVIKGYCATCKKEILIFDSRKHGWDGYICKLFIDKNPDLFETVNFKDETIFQVDIFIYSEGEKDFIKEACEESVNNEGLRFKPNEWVNAFSNITINLNQNNKKIKCFSFETM